MEKVFDGEGHPIVRMPNGIEDDVDCAIRDYFHSGWNDSNGSEYKVLERNGKSLTVEIYVYETGVNGKNFGEETFILEGHTKVIDNDYQIMVVESAKKIPG